MVAYKFIQLKLGRNFPCINHMPECREKGGFPRAGKTNNHVAQFSHGNTSSVVRLSNRSNSLLSRMGRRTSANGCRTGPCNQLRTNASTPKADGNARLGARAAMSQNVRSRSRG